MMQTTVRSGACREYRPFPNLAHRNALQERFEVPTLVRLLHVPQCKRILEVGCGRGVALPALARFCRPARLTGLELDPRLLDEAAATAKRERIPVELVQGDVREMPFESESFDLLVDFGTCYHVDRPDDALAEIERVLAPGGIFVHETRLGQLFAHPVRSLGHALPWQSAPRLVRRRHALLWASEMRQESLPRPG